MCFEADSRSLTIREYVTVRRFVDHLRTPRCAMLFRADMHADMIRRRAIATLHSASSCCGVMPWHEIIDLTLYSKSLRSLEIVLQSLDGIIIRH